MFSNFKLADGYVTALDLFSMNCQANLVALSGCQSGLGQSPKVMIFSGSRVVFFTPALARF